MARNSKMNFVVRWALLATLPCGCGETTALTHDADPAGAAPSTTPASTPTTDHDDAGQFGDRAPSPARLRPGAAHALDGGQPIMPRPPVTDAGDVPADAQTPDGPEGQTSPAYRDTRNPAPSNIAAAAGLCPDASLDAGMRSDEESHACSPNPNGCRSPLARPCSGDCVASTCAQTSVYHWTANEVVYPNAVAADAQGNAYVVGMTTTALADFGAPDTQAAFITKWSPSGQRLWDALWPSGPSAEISLPAWANDVAVSPTGDRIAVAGSLGGSIWLGVWSTVSSAPPLWTRSISNPGPTPDPEAEAEGVVFGPDGDVYVAGTVYRGALTSQPNAGGHDAFAMRVRASDGSTQWSAQWGGTNHDGAHDIATDGTVVYVAGSSNVLSETQDTTTGDAFLRAVDANGVLLWERVIDNGERDSAKAVAASADGHLVLAGISYQESGQGFLTELTSANEVEWSESVTIQDDVEMDAAGNTYAVFFTTLSKHYAGTEVWSLQLLPVGAYAGDLAVWDGGRGGPQIYTVGQQSPGQDNPHGFLAITTAE